MAQEHSSQRAPLLHLRTGAGQAGVSPDALDCSEHLGQHRAKPLQHDVSARAPSTAETQQDTRYSASTMESEPRLLLQQQQDSCGDWRGAQLHKQSPLHTCSKTREPLQRANQTCSRWEHRLWSNKVCAQAPPDRSSQLPLPKTGSVSSKAAVTMPSLH